MSRKGQVLFMNNNYNDFDEKKNEGAENAERTDDVRAESTGAPETPTASQNGGEYSMNGAQMGEHGRETFSGVSRSFDPRNDAPRFDPHTGKPLNADPAPKFDPQTGEPLSNGPRFDPHTGAPLRTDAQHDHRPPFGEPPAPPAKQKKARRGVSAAALAITCAACILFSAAAGFGGAYLYSSQNGGSTVIPSGSSTVVERTVNTDSLVSSTGDTSTYMAVASAVKDSVVEITTEFQVTGFFQYVTDGAGSGVIISNDGYIITNNHVIVNSSTSSVADTIKVRLTNGKEYDATLVGRDSDSDIAVIKITPDEELTAAVFGNSDNLAVGEEVIAVGNPLGELGGTVTNGIVSALDREISVDGTTMNLLQTNAAINPGNSGGGLFNMKGELVGIVNAKSSGSGIEGLGFAIPANGAYDVAKKLMENGYVTGKAYIGVAFYEADDAYTAYRYFRSQSTGLYVSKLYEGYNENVLKYGDRIVAVDGEEITSFSTLKALIKTHSVGDTLKFTVYRDGKLTEVDVKCYEYVPDKEMVEFDGNSSGRTSETEAVG